MKLSSLSLFLVCGGMVGCATEPEGVFTDHQVMDNTDPAIKQSLKTQLGLLKAIIKEKKKQLTNKTYTNLEQEFSELEQKLDNANTHDDFDACSEVINAKIAGLQGSSGEHFVTLRNFADKTKNAILSKMKINTH